MICKGWGAARLAPRDLSRFLIEIVPELIAPVAFGEGCRGDRSAEKVVQWGPAVGGGEHKQPVCGDDLAHQPVVASVGIQRHVLVGQAAEGVIDVEGRQGDEDVLDVLWHVPC